MIVCIDIKRDQVVFQSFFHLLLGLYLVLKLWNPSPSEEVLAAMFTISDDFRDQLRSCEQTVF